MRRLAAALVVLSLAACGRAEPGPAVDESALAARAEEHRREVESWRRERIARLTAEDGWLAVVGLEWLAPGVNPAGAAPDQAVLLLGRGVPRRVGSFVWKGEEVTFEPARGARVTHRGERVDGPIAMHPDVDGEPTKLEVATLTFHVIRRGERFGVRVVDRTSSARRDFSGIRHYPVSLDWRVEGRFEPYDPPRTLRVPNYVGTVGEEPSPGAVVFELDGRTHRLEALEGGGEAEGVQRLFLIFADATSGNETYGGGRYLYADAPDDGGPVVLDFNKAYNPPCVFTPFATCPLPPRDNRLDFALEAGERAYSGPVAGRDISR